MSGDGRAASNPTGAEVRLPGSMHMLPSPHADRGQGWWLLQAQNDYNNAVQPAIDDLNNKQVGSTHAAQSVTRSLGLHCRGVISNGRLLVMLRLNLCPPCAGQPG